MAYQERWIRGQTTPGDRACADRYALVSGVVEEFRRQVTVWDLGANLGYFGCRLAHDYGTVSVMVEPRAELVDVCQANALPTTIAMTHRLTAVDLGELAASEHADVVLCLNVLHHMPDWSSALDAVLSLGTVAVIETPGRDDVGTAHFDRSRAVLDRLEAMGLAPVDTTPSHVTPGVRRPVFVSRHVKPHLTAGYAYRARVRARGAHPVRPHVITSTLDTKAIAFYEGEARPWVHGMNLWNWLQLGGSYPHRETVQ